MSTFRWGGAQKETKRFSWALGFGAIEFGVLTFARGMRQMPAEKHFRSFVQRHTSRSIAGSDNEAESPAIKQLREA
jgi:hypothetical protein